MFSKEAVREALKAQDKPSEHLKVKRILFQTRRQFTEMLETYRSQYAPTDRDNDPLFIHRLIDLAWDNEKWLQDCPWEHERDEPLSSQYPLNFSIPQYQKIESLAYEWGSTLQASVSALVYTGLLLTYPVYKKGDKVKIQVLQYPNAPFQPNEEHLSYQGKTGTITKKSNLRVCWESVDILNTTEPIAIRKDWITPIK
jgi:ribosomal protein L21E